MKILTVKQPWAWLIVSGLKDIENRSWATKYRGPLLIQSSAKLPPRDEFRASVELALARGVNIDESLLRFGGIVGMVQLLSCVRSHDSVWFQGPIGWVLRDAQPLPFVPIVGQQGIFEASHALLDQLKLPKAFPPLFAP